MFEWGFILNNRQSKEKLLGIKNYGDVKIYRIF